MKIGEYQLESPLINAGGLVKTVEDARQMAATGVGAVLAGSFTLDPRIGNSPNGEVVYYHDPASSITYNSLGMPNKGMETVAKDLRDMIKIAHDFGKPFILNFAPVSDNPIAEVITMSEILARANIENLDGLELNASCPNVVTGNGGRHELLSHHPEFMADVLMELRDISANEVPFGSLLVRISPFRSADDAKEMARVLQARDGVDAVSAFNTLPGGRPLDAAGTEILQVPGGLGGMSGPGMCDEMERQTVWLVDARSEVNGTFEIIGSNGIHDAQSIQRRLNLGVSAVSATTLFWEAQNWGNAANEPLQAFSEL